jgi:hypothetical protein
MIVSCVHHRTEVIYQAKFDGAAPLLFFVRHTLT